LIKCLFCDGIIECNHTGGVYKYFKCNKCGMNYARHKHIEEWIYIENRPWKNNYGEWVVCTKEIEKNKTEEVIFT